MMFLWGTGFGVECRVVAFRRVIRSNLGLRASFLVDDFDMILRYEQSIELHIMPIPRNEESNRDLYARFRYSMLYVDTVRSTSA